MGVIATDRREKELECRPLYMLRSKDPSRFVARWE
jgi:hypothetical protein